MKLHALCVLMCCVCSLYAQDFKDSIDYDNLSIGHQVDEINQQDVAALDSIIVEYEKQQLIHKAIGDYQRKLLKKESQLEWTNIFPVGKGLFVTLTSKKFKERNDIFQHHHTSYVDFLPATLPLATTWGLKALGVEARSKTKRMAVANALALGIGLGTTKVMSHLVDETRPDRRGNDAFPSDHATLAFISASILDREFGHHSPWISIGGYTLAFASQFQRIHANRHYLNDVLMGAGIGTVSTNLAYFITDKCLGDKYINKPFVSKYDMIQYEKFLNRPTSFAIYSAVETGYNKLKEDDFEVLEPSTSNYALRSTSALSTALECDFYLNRSLAIEAMFRLTQMKIQVLPLENDAMPVYGNNGYQYHFDVGAKYSWLLGLDKRFAVRAFVGDRLVPEMTFRQVDTMNPLIRIPNENKMEMGVGIAMDMLSTKKYLSGFAVDYTHACSSLLPNRWVIASYFKLIL